MELLLVLVNVNVMSYSYTQRQAQSIRPPFYRESQDGPARGQSRPGAPGGSNIVIIYTV